MRPDPGTATALMDTNRASLQLPPRRRSAAEARAFVSSTLVAWGHVDSVDTVALLASELVTNSVVHAGTGLEVTLDDLGPSVRLSVQDADTRPPVPRRPVSDSLSTGRGLTLIAALSLSWGVEMLPDGKLVWCEVALSEAAA